MDEKYDYIVLGTGLKECILSSLLSKSGKKVLHMDRNNYYGGEMTSFCPLDKLFEYFGKKDLYDNTYGANRDWNVDLIPKFLMGDGLLVKLLIATDVTKYLNFKVVQGSYVYVNGKIMKVPANETEALSSSIMGIFEKRRFRNFLTWAVQLDIDKVPVTKSIKEIFDEYSLSENTCDFIIHAICLYKDDGYKQNQVSSDDVVRRIKLYSNSLARFGKSPYLYPLYGLGELPQSFARLSAVHGGIYMLDKPGCEIIYENGKVVGVKSDGETARCDNVICDPSYAPEKCKVVGKVVRSIVIFTQPVIKNDLSMQIILPQSQINRKHDIYISITSYDLNVAPKDFYLALVATTVENPDGDPEKEIEAGLKLLPGIKQKFTKVYDISKPIHDPKESNVYVSESYDATTHFETTCTDVLRLYKEITGKDYKFEENLTIGAEQ